ncbi:MAG: phosphatase PAP2 family protein [Actinobacteria bacterium]|nr:phosphatase PAP2 family protein [Actinomycetota bacterium]
MLTDRLAVRREERLMWKLVKTGSRHGTSPASRAGDVASNPLTWACFAAVLSLTGRRGRRAVVRGLVCSGTASALHLPIKRVVGRSRPRGARLIASGPGPLTSSFPSGHTASDLGFLFGASQELPLLLLPGSVATACSHWSLIRTRKHYPSDVIGGGAIAVAVAAAAWKLRPPPNTATRRLHKAVRQQASTQSSDARIRVKVGRHWHRGTAQILPDDDAVARLRWLERPVNDALLLLIGTQQLTIRVDLDSESRGTHEGAITSRLASAHNANDGQ